jgi:hypothetical protein
MYGPNEKLTESLDYSIKALKFKKINFSQVKDCKSKHGLSRPARSGKLTIYGKRI